jgi:hypothetical protein
VSVRLFPEEVCVWIRRQSKEGLPSLIWVGVIQPIENPNRVTWRKSQFSVSLLELRHPSSPALGHWNSWFLNLWIWTTHFLWCLATDNRMWNFWASEILWANSYNKLTHLYLYPISTSSLENPDWYTNTIGLSSVCYVLRFIHVDTCSLHSFNCYINNVLLYHIIKRQFIHG